MALKSNTGISLIELSRQLEAIQGNILSLEEIEHFFHACDRAAHAFDDPAAESSCGPYENAGLTAGLTKSDLVSLTRYFILLYNHRLFQPEETGELIGYLERCLATIQRHEDAKEDLPTQQPLLEDLDWQFIIRGDRNTIASYGDIILTDKTAREKFREYIYLELQHLPGDQDVHPDTAGAA